MKYKKVLNRGAASPTEDMYQLYANCHSTCFTRGSRVNDIFPDKDWVVHRLKEFCKV